MKIILENSKKLIIEDKVYGLHKIENFSPLLIPILKSEAFLRMGKISQHGIPAVIGWSPFITRLEHMVGSFLLTRKCGGNFDEQIAALLHDITHRTFSHNADYIFSSLNESYHEIGIHDFLKKTDLPNVLGNNWEKYFDLKEFTLLEKNSPALCADRGDYFPRDLCANSFVSGKYTKKYFESIEGINGRDMVINDLNFAKKFALDIFHLDENFYSSKSNVGVNHLAADILKKALELNIIEKKDFDEKGCQELWSLTENKFKNQNFKELFKILYAEGFFRANNIKKSHFKLTTNDEMPDENWILLKKNIIVKPRILNPLVKIEKEIKTICEWDKNIDKKFKFISNNGLIQKNLFYSKIAIDY